MKRWISWLQNHKLYAVLACITILTSILMLISFEYMDVDSITAWSLNFWDLLFKGRLDEFYQYAAENLRGAAHSNCSANYLWLLPVCVWNFPLWVVYQICGIMSVHYFFSLCWTRLFWFLAQIITALTCRKICLMLTKNDNRESENTGILAFLLVMAAPEIMISVEYVGQDEIIYICLFTLALYEYLCEKWWKCYLLTICCVSLCPIMLLPCLALFLLKEKNIMKLLGLTVGTTLPTVLFEFLYRNDEIYQLVKQGHNFGNMIIDFFSEYRIMPETNELSYSLITLLILYFVCYTTKKEQGEEYQRKTVFMMAMAFFIIGFLMKQDFYRLFLWVPFFVILILSTQQNRNMNLCLFTMLTYGRAIQICSILLCLNTGFAMPWLKGLSSRENDNFLWPYFGNFFETDDIPSLVLLIAQNMSMAVAILLLVINRPNSRKQYEITIRAKVSAILYTCCMPLIMVAFFFMLF